MTCSLGLETSFFQRRCFDCAERLLAHAIHLPPRCSICIVCDLRSCVALVLALDLAVACSLLELVVKRWLLVVRSIPSRVAEPRVCVARVAALELDLAVACSLLAHLLIRPMPTLSRRRHRLARRRGRIAATRIIRARLLRASALGSQCRRASGTKRVRARLRAARHAQKHTDKELRVRFYGRERKCAEMGERKEMHFARVPSCGGQLPAARALRTVTDRQTDNLRPEW